MELKNLIWTSVQPILKTVFLSLTGTLLASRKIKALSEAGIISLSQLCFLAFSPSLILTSAPETFGNASSVSSLWLLPLSCLLNMVFGCLCALIMLLLARFPRDLWIVLLSASAVGNYGNLPIVIVSAFCRDPASPFFARENCEQDGIGFVASGFWIGAVAIWAIIYPALAPSEEEGKGKGEEVEKENKEKEEKDREGKASLRNSRLLSPRKRTHHHEGPYKEDGQELEMLIRSDESMLEEQEDPEEGEEEAKGRSEEESPKEEEVREENAREKRAQRGRIGFKRIKGIAWTVLKNLFNPPILATGIAALIGLVPALRDAFFGENAPLQPITDLLRTLGGALIPCIMIVLGANLKGPMESKLDVKMIVGVCVIRLAVLPALGLASVAAFGWMGWLPEEDVLFKFVLLLNGCLPTAANVGMVATLRKKGSQEISVLFFWEYILSCVAMALWILLFLYLLENGL